MKAETLGSGKQKLKQVICLLYIDTRRVLWEVLGGRLRRPLGRKRQEHAMCLGCFQTISCLKMGVNNRISTPLKHEYGSVIN